MCHLQVKELLTTCGAEEFITIFAKKEISFKEIQFMEDKDLREVRYGGWSSPHTMRRFLQMGISSEYMRNTIKVAIEEYSAMEDRLKEKISKIETGASEPSAPSEHLDDEAPTAPPLSSDSQEPSAPALIQTFHSPECVVCLERKVRFVLQIICQKDNQIGS